MQRLRQRQPEHFDTGAPLVGRHHTIIITGIGRQRRARVLDQIAAFPAPEKDAAEMLRGLFEAAQFNGFAHSRLERGYGRSQPEMLVSEHAYYARQKLNWYRERMPGELWSVLWFRLYAEESDVLVSARLGVPPRAVRGRLRGALQWVAGLRNATR